MKTSSRYVVSGFLLLGWTMLVLWAYFHSFPLVHLPEILKNSVVFVLLLLFFTALGARILRLWSLLFPSFAEEIGISFGLGSGVTALLMFGLCALQIAYEIVIFVLVLLLFGAVYQDAKSLCVRGYSRICGLRSRTRSATDIMLLVLLTVAGLATYLAAATPPFFYDAMVYHLAVPQQYLLESGFRYMPYHHFSNFPMNLNMLFMVGMSFSGGMLAKLISWSFAPMTAVAVYGFAKSRWGHHMALTAAAIVFLIPGVLILSTLTSIDLGVMFYSFLSFSALTSWFSSRQRSHFMLSALFCGLAIGTKYTALAITFGAIIIILVCHEYIFARKRRFLQTILAVILFGLLALCVASPWFLKNIVYTGNPVYPFLNSLFSTKVEHQYRFYDQALSTRSSPISFVHSIFSRDTVSFEKWGNSLAQYASAPWRVSLRTNRGAGITGIIFLMCLPLFLLIKKQETTLRYLCGLGGCGFFLWIIVFPQTALRYAFQIFPPLSLGAAYTLWSLPVEHRMRTWIMAGLGVLLGYQVAIFFQVQIALNPYSYLFNNQSQHDFLLEHGINYYPVAQYIDTQLPIDSKILYVGELRSYYIYRKALLATDAHIRDESNILRNIITESASSQEVLDQLRELSITHLLFNQSEMERFAESRLKRDSYMGFESEKDTEIFNELLSSKTFALRVSQAQVLLFEIMYPPHMIP